MMFRIRVLGKMFVHKKKGMGENSYQGTSRHLLLTKYW